MNERQENILRAYHADVALIQNVIVECYSRATPTFIQQDGQLQQVDDGLSPLGKKVVVQAQALLEFVNKRTQRAIEAAE